MKNDTQDTTQGSKKSPIALLNPLMVIFSAINTGMLVTVRLIYITSQQIGAASIVLGNIGTGIFLVQYPWF
ncbi:hypothetical protein [Wolbachia endosymbiont of Ctenocephalides felis wCfeJ]|uniref:hypothetical protein n=1 Tax=Wolbachia endosymbiont of Ctenocephalides felis wCfeJ TaxID=2732594 RepID=UPI001FE6356D|nr:hypothetical protein [Wolbachia endosymbiont of Ctenocephalides felis wCfeJ]WCR58061.1 MAG: hypothetical protein PG980_000533 [Wolbachia endosymbiont of Ctenocephalides felis wCfeJ]